MRLRTWFIVPACFIFFGSMLSAVWYISAPTYLLPVSPETYYEFMSARWVTPSVFVSLVVLIFASFLFISDNCELRSTKTVKKTYTYK